MRAHRPGYGYGHRTPTRPRGAAPMSATKRGSPGKGSAGGRNLSEDEHERLTRNLNELLQELRVTQTGVQILTGFLLTLPFTDRFKTLDGTQKSVYLGVLVGSVLATGLIIAPVA